MNTGAIITFAAIAGALWLITENRKRNTQSVRGNHKAPSRYQKIKNMTETEFRENVAAMRDLQKKFIRTKDASDLQQAKVYERRIDAEIKRVQALKAEEERKAQFDAERQTTLDF